MIAGAQPQEKAALVVSWSSLEKRKAEYEELVKKKIPENIKEIALARSYGDLSENFEYKAAKQMQAVLARQRASSSRRCKMRVVFRLKIQTHPAFSIGTIITVRDKASKKQETYTILGAWTATRIYISFLIKQQSVRHSSATRRAKLWLCRMESSRLSQSSRRHWTSLLLRRLAKLSQRLFRQNGANGISDIEGKAVRVAASERGQRVSFN